jgi:hypothetical protein
MRDDFPTAGRCRYNQEACLVNIPLDPNASAAPELSLMRSSDVLRGVLAKNPGVQTFTIERILASIGSDRVEASMMMFSLPAIVPVSGPSGLVTLPTGAIGCQIAAGRKQVRLPRYILKKTVSRKSLAVAIHAILPILEAAEKVVRPRWGWACHPLSRRVVGLLVFLLAIAIAYPLFGFNAFHAISIFVISVGLAEQDGLAVMLGVVAGVLSLAVLSVSGFSARGLFKKLTVSLRKLARKLGLEALGDFLDRRGYKRLARIVTFQWSDLLLIWDPERGAMPRPVGHDRSVSAARSRSVARAPARRPTPGGSDRARVERRSAPSRNSKVVLSAGC